MVSIFLSHSSKDHDFVEELARKLKERGIEVWVDDAEIKAGDSFIDKFSGAIDEVNFVGIVLSQSSLESGWVKEEINMGVYNEIVGRKIKVIPILLEDVEIPPILRIRNTIDFREESRYEQEFIRLLDAMNVTISEEEKGVISKRRHIPQAQAELIIDYLPKDGAKPQVEVFLAHGWETKKAKSDFAFEFEEGDRKLIQWYMEDYILYPYDLLVKRAKEVEELMLAKGDELFRAVFSNEDTKSLYDQIKDRISQHRITIRADDQIGRSLPWELMHDKEKGYLAQCAYSFTRSRPDITSSFEPEPVANINILMVISRPHGKEDVRFQSVARPLLEVFRSHRNRITLDILRPPTYERLVEVLAERPDYYHIIHFDGHGSLSRSNVSNIFYGDRMLEGVLAFEDEKAKDEPKFVSGRELGELLRSQNIPVVMLNACQSGMADPDSMFPSLGDELLGAGVHGVVAMAYSVYVPTAVKFMAKVYELLVNGQSLERAVSASRLILCNNDLHDSPAGEIHLKDWSVPVIFQSGSVRLFEPPKNKLALVTEIKGEQEKAGGEIDLPDKPDYGFIGRDGLMLDMERAFRRENVILLQGMAGMGKSTLAVGFSRWLGETGGLDGPIFFFDFQKHLTLAHICDKIGGVFFGTKWHQLDTPQKRENAALNALKQIPCLLIWDNFETVMGIPRGSATPWSEEERNELQKFLSKTRDSITKVMVTSRMDEKWLGTWIERLMVEGLDMQEAFELAGKVLEKEKIDRKTIKPYKELLEYLRGNPLAIQVMMQELRRIEPDELLSQLKSGEAELKYDDAEQGRTKSLTVSLNYRLDNMNPGLRKRLSILALFQGVVNCGVLELISSFDERSNQIPLNPPLAKGGIAEGLKGISKEVWERDLDLACEAGIVQRIAEGIYSIHPALPWFFSNALAESFPGEREGLERVFARVYGDYSGELSNLFNSNPQTAMAYLRIEEANLMKALAIARRYGDWWAVEYVLYGLEQLLDTSGRWTERERIIGDIWRECAGPDNQPIPGRESLWLIAADRMSLIAMNHGKLDDAFRLYELQLGYDEKRAGKDWENKTNEQLTDDERNVLRNMAAALHQLGMIEQERGRYDSAEEYYTRSLKIEEKVGNEQGQAQALHQLGRIEEIRGRYDSAEDYYTRSLEIKEKIGNEQGQAITLHQLGMIEQMRERYDSAEGYYTRSLKIAGKIGDEQGQAQSLHQLGMIEEERGRYDSAEGWYTRSLRIEEKIGNEHGQAITLHQLGIIEEKRERYDSAEGYYTRSLKIAEKIGDEHGQALTYGQLGRLAEKRGNLREAEAFLTRAEAIFRRFGDARSLKIAQDSLKRVRGTNE